MYFIAAFGALMMGLSVFMIASPNQWSKSIIRFSEKPYFHWFEVATRLISGLVFVEFSEQVKLSAMFLGFGYVMIAVAIGLTLLGPSKHVQFARWSAVKFKPSFRGAGVGSLLFGAAIIYLTLS